MHLTSVGRSSVTYVLSLFLCADHPPRPRRQKRPRGSQQAVQDRRFWHVKVRQRGRRGDRDQTRQKRPTHPMDGSRIIDLLPVHDED